MLFLFAVDGVDGVFDGGGGGVNTTVDEYRVGIELSTKLVCADRLLLL